MITGGGELEVLDATQRASPRASDLLHRMSVRSGLEAKPELGDQASKRALRKTAGTCGKKLLPLGKCIEEDIQRHRLVCCTRALGRQIRYERNERIRKSVNL